MIFSEGPTFSNSYDEPLNFACSNNEHLTKVKSKYSTEHKDRTWGYGCTAGELHS